MWKGTHQSTMLPHSIEVSDQTSDRSFLPCQRDLKTQLRQNGEALHLGVSLPTVTDNTVLTCEIAGDFLEYGTDKCLFQYFRRNHEDPFPKLNVVCRTPLTRVNLWSVRYMLRHCFLSDDDHLSFSNLNS